MHHDGFNEKYVLDFLIVLRDRKGMSTRTGTWPVGRAGRVLATAFAPVAWGTTYIVTTGLLPGGHPMFAALMRSLPVGVVVVLVARSLPRGKWWWRFAVLGTLNIGVFFPLLFLSAERLPGGVAATLGASQPVFVAFLAVALLQEQLSGWRLVWGAIGMIGVGCVVLGPGAGFDLVGFLAGVGGALAMGTGVVLTKRWGRPPGFGPISFAGWQLCSGGILLLIPALLIEGVPAHIDSGAVMGYIWLGLAGGLVAYSLWFFGIGTLPVTATALLGLLSPMVAAVLGMTMGGERPTPLQFVGFALALAAMFAGQFGGHAENERADSTESKRALRHISLKGEL